MRKLKVQVQLSIDGFIAGTNGEMDWMVWDWDEELKRYVEGLTEPVDCIVLGRNLAQGFIPHWASVASNPEHPEFASGKKFSETNKVVFTRTLTKSPWTNTVLAHGDLVEEITRLKNQDGKDIIAYGGGLFVSALMETDLIDEFHFFINPVALGTGMAIFQKLEDRRTFVLETSRAFDCGIVVIKYRRAT